jgi:hypothetical protein
MLYHRRSRRQFLAGAGRLSLLMPLPVLPSLMPRSAWSATPTPPIRFVQCVNWWGQFDQYFNPKPTLQVLDAANDVKGAQLSDIQGPISKVIGPAFDGIRSKLNVIKGLHVLAASTLHNSSMHNCASGCSAGDFSHPRFPYSVEYVLANSKKVYPGDSSGIVPFVGVTRSYDNQCKTCLANSAWTPTGRMSDTSDLKAVYSKFARAFNPTLLDPRMDPVQLERIKLVQEVYQDYKSVVSSGKLSSTDRPRFEAYMALVASVEASLSAPVKTCQDPKPTFSSDRVEAENDLARMLTAALACQLTSVIDYAILPEDTMHGAQHGGQAVLHSDNSVRYGRAFAYLFTLLDTVKDADGKSVLDNSLAYWGNHAGLVRPGGDAHTRQNMPLVVAGSAGGRLRTGYYLEYANRPYNNWLITVFNAMGLSAPDYELNSGQAGFGEYNAQVAQGATFNVAPALLTDAERRKPLPFLFR